MSPKRLARLSFWRSHLLLVGAAVATGLLLTGALYLRAFQSTETSRLICAKIDKIDSVLYQLVHDQAPSNVDDAPGAAYYRDHDEEYRRALLANRRALTKLRGASCNPAAIAPRLGGN